MPVGIAPLGLPTLPETAAEQDVRLYAAWKKAVGFQKEQALNDLMRNLNGAIMTAVNAYSGAPMPRATMELQAKLYAREAVQNYDASKGMSLASYVTTIVKQKLYRYVGTYQNVGRIPEEHIRMIGPLREAMGELENKFGRDPSTAELADHMGLPIKKVTELRKLLRKDLLEEGALEPLNAFQHDAEYEKAMLAYYSMSDTERLVFDYSLGAHNQPQLSTNDIAKKLKVSAARVSQLKKSVADKIKPYLGGII